MKRFKNILVVCDFAVKQQVAIDRASSLANQNEARLTVLTVVKELPADTRMAVTGIPPGKLLERVIDEHRKKTDALAVDIGRQGVDTRSRVVTGVPFLEIIRQVLRDGHDLVILAAEGKGGIKERLFGSTSMHLMRKCPCPVWVAKSTGRATYKRILAAVDTTSDFPDPERQSLNPLILQLAGSLARIDHSELHIVQVWSVFAEGYIEVRAGLSEKSIRNARKLTKQLYASRLDSLLVGADLKGLVTHRHLPRNDDAPRPS